MNLSKWAEYSVVRRERYLSEIANQVKDRGMPLAIYTFMHRDARLSDEEINIIFDWTQKERLRLIEQSIAGRAAGCANVGRAFSPRSRLEGTRVAAEPTEVGL
jgi:hypothetical protein